MNNESKEEKRHRTSFAVDKHVWDKFVQIATDRDRSSGYLLREVIKKEVELTWKKNI